MSVALNLTEPFEVPPGLGTAAGQGIPKICTSPASNPVPQDAGEELVLEFGEDGAAGAASGEPPGYEDYSDGDPASPERFGPAEREETVIRAPQVTLGTRTGTPSRHGWTSWGHGMGSGGPVGAVRSSAPSSRPRSLTPVPPRCVPQEPSLKGDKGEPAVVEPVSKGGARSPRGHLEPSCGSPGGGGLQDGARGRAVLTPFSFRVGDLRGRRDPRALR